MKRQFLIPALAVCTTIGTAWQYRFLVAQDASNDPIPALIAETDAKEFAARKSYETAIAIARDGQPIAIASEPGQSQTFSYWTRSPGQSFLYTRSATESDRKAMEAAEKFNRESDEEKKSALLDEVKSLVAQAFEEQMAVREKEIGRVQKQLDELKAKMKSRKDLADDIIERRVRDLTRQPDKLDWFDGAQRFPGFRSGGLTVPTPTTPGRLRGTISPAVPGRFTTKAPRSTSPPRPAGLPGIEN